MAPAAPLHSGSLTVASFWVEHLLDAALHAGVDLSDALVRLGVSEADLESPHARLPLKVEQRLLEHAVTRSGDPLFGLHMGEGIRPRFMGELGYASMSSATLRDAIELMIPFTRVTSEFFELRFEWRDDDLWLIWDTLDNSPLSGHRVDATLAGAVVFGRWILGEDHDPLAVHLVHPAPDQDDEYRRVFRCPIHFGQTLNAVVLDAGVLDRPLRDADPEVHRLARSRVQRAVTQYRARDNLLEQVRLEIQQRLIKGIPQLEPIAERLGVKPWTLRRRLRAEQTDFSTLLEDERRRLACDWLRHSDRSVNQIALDLGYSEQSAFNRAFKRWFGVTPVHYREHHRDAPSP
ncbi:AraC family transcriptional regulator [Alloalcanivorax gelatiniphagus]|uniref:AraC family transcriptional regulator n=1 Tax=Alloalcanivorax gelatiniphagus TaxID=1194167 RepID=A0ABY2XN92_9GAMM|nr:AraC family transcriptional regulator [Alloalcanivorax gelatiniphagus]TMW13909.1 AraC family transcriptional regulator [Alloalcanivorax gelatiniphagus]